MAYVQSAVSPRDFPENAPRAKRSWLSRLLDALERASMRQAEREVARYLRANGGKFTDETERDLSRRFLIHS
jgi:hypothetical protein